jgi:hypothetical protein
MRLIPALGQNTQTFPFLNKNLIAEKTPTGMVARARPALSQLVDVGTGTLRGIFCKSGVLDGDIVVVMDTSAYRVTAAGISTQITGTIASDGRVAIDGGLATDGTSLIRIANGSALYKVTSSAVTAEDFPAAAGAGASDVCYSKGYWIAAEAGTQTVYYLIPGDTVWNALEFATAEYSADLTKGLRPFGDYIYIFGSATTEVWTLTGDVASPIEPVSGLAMDFGCRARDAVAANGEALLWVDDQCQVRLTLGGQAEIVSEEWLQEKIAEGDPVHLRAWLCTWRQHPLYILTLGAGGTYVFDLSTRLWSEWTSKDRTFFRGHLGAENEAAIFAADAAANSGVIYKFDADAFDDEGDEIEALCTFYQDQSEARETVTSAVLACEQGNAPRTGQGSSPLAALRWSDDGGHAYTDWKYASTGATGHFVHPPRWNRLGMTRPPHGRIYELRISDPIGRVIRGLDVNV